MLRTVLFVTAGYLSGSVLYANLFCRLFTKENNLQKSKDKNPGTANAFQYGGFWCGVCTLLCDLFKGFLPVYLYSVQVKEPVAQGLSLVLAAPVVGHIFPVTHKLHGGKGIAATFGCLLGLFPYGLPVCLFAGIFIFLSVGLRITPHYYRTLAAYPCTFISMLMIGAAPAVCAGFFIITAAVCFRLCLSKEEKEKIEVKLLWMR